MTTRVSINTMALKGKIPQGDPRWATFNDSFVNKELEIIDLANEIYTGHSYAGWHNGRRSIDNFILGQYIGVDLDTGDKRSTFEYLLQHDFVKTYGGLLHTTPSHTDENPRCRVLFFLDEPITDALGFQSAAKFVGSLFSGSDPAVTDASRFFYGARDCKIELPMNELPLSHLRCYYAKNAKKNPPPQQAKTYSKSTNESPDLAEVRVLLDKIKPYSVDYNRWIGLIAALKREFGDAAKGLAIDWAKGKDGEVEKEWERIVTDRGKKMGIGTIIALANGKVF